jgi:uncharacterized delta-60 repeat protein
VVDARLTQPDGKVIAVGSAALLAGTYTGSSFGIERRNADGSLDATFSGGVVKVPIWGYADAPVAIALDSEGSIFVGGNAMDPIASVNYYNCEYDRCATYPAVVKLKPDGTLDASFGRVILNATAYSLGTYRSILDVPDDAYLRSIAVQPDGKVLVRTADGKDAARINPDGSLDTSFAATSRVEVIRLAELPEAANFQGLWWGGPAQSGWNLTLAHQGEVIFATWATYDDQGQPVWVSMTATQFAPASYRGTLYRTTGPLGRVTLQALGSGTLVFSSGDEARFDYQLRGTLCGSPAMPGPFQPICEDQKVISRFGLAGPQPTCVFNRGEDPKVERNYTDLWISDPPGSDWGSAVSIAHVGNTIFVTWLTYDLDGSPTWLFGSGNYVYGDFEGRYIRTRGQSPFSSSYDPKSVTYTDAGEMYIEGKDGNHLVIYGAANQVQQTRELTRYVFRGNGTTCR